MTFSAEMIAALAAGLMAFVSIGGLVWKMSTIVSDLEAVKADTALAHSRISEKDDKIDKLIAEVHELHVCIARMETILKKQNGT